MRTLVHLSDLHFGRIDEAIIAPLITAVHAAQPNLVVISGDLTQRARTDEFKEAQKFLAALPLPQIVVPGNHDIPLHNLVRRFIDPLKKYQRYICDSLEPAFIDAEIAVAGINTARSLTIKDGRINAAQMDHVRQQWSSIDAQTTKIIVTHHPFDIAGEFNQTQLVGRAQQLMPELVGLDVDLLLAGHHHVAHAENTIVNYPGLKRAALVVQAGTATSTRGRGEVNSFNLLHIESGHIIVERHEWQVDKLGFFRAAVSEFRDGLKGWSKVSADDRTA